jgi:hypothetical protein
MKKEANSMIRGTTNNTSSDADATPPPTAHGRRQSIPSKKEATRSTIEFSPTLPPLPSSTPAIALTKKGSLVLLFATLSLGGKTMRAVSHSLAKGLDTVRLQLGDLLEKSFTRFGKDR